MKKVLSLMLCLALMMTISPITGLDLSDKASAEGVFSTAVSNVVTLTDDGVEHNAQLTPWDGKAAEIAPETTMIDGEVYYMIEDAADLAWYSNKVNKGNSSSNSTNRESNAILVNDIDLNGHNWYNYRIGQSWYFAGTFDGQGHTIHNLYIESSSIGSGGFFGSIGISGKAATIKNVNFENAKVVSAYTGGYGYITTEMTSVVCGYMTAKDSLIENVSVSGKITVKSSSNSIIGAGSIVGLCKKGTIKNCYSDVDFELANAKNLRPEYFSGSSEIYGIGGIVGVWAVTSTADPKVVEGTLTQCGYEGTINAPQNSRVGGIIGNLSTYRYFSFNRCYSTGNIIGYRQVGGIVGWAYDGVSVYHSPLYVYSAANVTAKTAEKSYAAGIANGYRGDSLTYPMAFMGDVKVDATVDGVKAPEFNNYCGLLFTTNAAADKGFWERLYITYIPRYYGNNVEKHIISHNGTAVKTAANVTACTENDFKSGRVFELLDKSGKAQEFTRVEGLNNSLLVHKWYAEAPITAANTYYVDNSSIELVFDTTGYAEFKITPVDGEVVVTIDDDVKTISEEGEYSFKVDNVETTMWIDGKAFVEKDVTEFKEATKLTDLIPTQIRVSFQDTQARDVVLALFKNNIFEKIVLNKEAQPEIINGESIVSAVIDLAGRNLAEYTLKAFLWESNTATPIEDSVYIGKTMGTVATDAEKAQAVSVVAQSYLDRGENIQYDNAVIAEDGYTRYEFGKSPEAYTSQMTGYVNSISFCYDVYKEALGIELPKTFEGLTTTQKIKVADASSLDVDDFENVVKPGDILVFGTESDNIAMIYTGDALVYSSGESYSVSYGEESYEADGAIAKIAVEDVCGGAYGDAVVVRPFNIQEDIIIPEKTICRVQNLQGIVVEKTSSHNAGVTAELGDEITYTFTIENKNDHETEVAINDVVPKYTELVSGCYDVDGSRLRWNVPVGAGDIETVSYTVKITSDSRYDGKTIESNSAKVSGVEVPCGNIKIGRTFKAGDISNLVSGIHAISHSQYPGVSLAKMIYTVSFSKSFTMAGTPAEILHQIYVEGSGDNEDTGIGGEDVPETVVNFLNMVVPTMYGGRKVGSSAETMIGSPRATTLDRENLIAGDFLLTQKNSSDDGKIYIYNGEKLVELSYGAYNVDDTDALLESLYTYDRFIVLRPSVSLNTFIHFEEDVEQELTPEQEAVVETAKSYLLRGTTLQYDDTRITASYDSTDEYRWQLKVNAPEDATSNEWAYSNCAAFTNDVYYFGLGFDVKTWSTDAYHQNSPASRVVYSFSKTGNETEAEKAAIQEEVLNVLQPGDVINIKRENNSGHAMLYVGNERIIHSSGSSFNYSTPAETYEATIRYRQVRDLFAEGDTSHIFGVVRDLDIIRPLNDFKGTIPQKTKNRIANMRGIRAEKLSSHTSSMTVNPGDEMTFTFSVYNANDEAVTLDVKDVIPSNTEYISGAEKVDGNNVSWNITVMPEETVDVSYKVRVKATATEGTYVACSKGSVGGVTVKCPDVKIGKTLTKTEQTNIAQTIESLKNSDLSGINLANTVYKNAFGTDVFTDYDENGSLTNDDVLNATFETTTLRPEYYVVNGDTEYGQMLAHPLFGGRYYYSKRWDNIRTRLPRKQHLITGDILVEYDGSTTKLYIFDGENLRDLNNNMAVTDTNKEFVKAMASNRFAVLRPSLVMD